MLPPRDTGPRALAGLLPLLVVRPSEFADTGDCASPGRRDGVEDDAGDGMGDEGVGACDMLDAGRAVDAWLCPPMDTRAGREAAPLEEWDESVEVELAVFGVLGIVGTCDCVRSELRGGRGGGCGDGDDPPVLAETPSDDPKSFPVNASEAAELAVVAVALVADLPRAPGPNVLIALSAENDGIEGDAERLLSFVLRECGVCRPVYAARRGGTGSACCGAFSSA